MKKFLSAMLLFALTFGLYSCTSNHDDIKNDFYDDERNDAEEVVSDASNVLEEEFSNIA